MAEAAPAHESLNYARSLVQNAIVPVRIGREVLKPENIIDAGQVTFSFGDAVVPVVIRTPGIPKYIEDAVRWKGQHWNNALIHSLLGGNVFLMYNY